MKVYVVLCDVGSTAIPVCVVPTQGEAQALVDRMKFGAVPRTVWPNGLAAERTRYRWEATDFVDMRQQAEEQIQAALKEFGVRRAMNLSGEKP